MNRIKELRIDNDLKMYQVAKFLNIKYQQYQRYEKNVTPNISIYILLAKYYNTSIDYIVGLTDEIKPYKKRVD